MRARWPQGVGFDDVVPRSRREQVQPSVAVDVIDTRTAENRAQSRIRPRLVQPHQRAELRTIDLDACDPLELRAPGEAEHRVARPEPDDCRSSRIRMNECWQRTEHRVDAAVRNPALADAVAEYDGAV